MEDGKLVKETRVSVMGLSSSFAHSAASLKDGVSTNGSSVSTVYWHFTIDVDLTIRVANKKANSILGQLLGTKEFIWRATRLHILDDWSEAGAIVTNFGEMG